LGAIIELTLLPTIITIPYLIAVLFNKIAVVGFGIETYFQLNDI